MTTGDAPVTTTSGRPFDSSGGTSTALACAPWPFVERRARSRRTGPDERVMIVRALTAQRRPMGLPTVIPTPRPISGTATRGLPGCPIVRTTVTKQTSWQRRMVFAVLAVDAMAAMTASAVAFLFDLSLIGHGGLGRLFSVIMVPAVWLGAVAMARGYQERLLGAGSEEFRRVLHAALGLLVTVAIASYAGHAQLARSYVLLTCGLCGVLSLAGRGACRAALRGARRSGRCQVDVLLVGHEGTVLHLVDQVRRERGGGLRVVGACVPDGSSLRLEECGVPVLGGLNAVSAVVQRFQVDAVAVTSCPELQGPALRRLSWELEGTGVDLVVAPGLVEVAGPRLHIRQMCGLPLLHVEEPELAGARRLIKGAVDRVIALVALLALSPLLLAVAVAVRATSAGPVLFKQTRVGRSGREFLMWKFRSMNIGAERELAELRPFDIHGDGMLFKLRLDPRVTRVGRLLRRTSLDELPQLFNVLSGAMSLVGPRPPLPGEVHRYGADVHRRLLVKPGLTGLWQVSGRSDLPWDESIRLDLRYVENWSLTLDALILWKTFAAVVRGAGAY